MYGGWGGGIHVVVAVACYADDFVRKPCGVKFVQILVKGDEAPVGRSYPYTVEVVYFRKWAYCVPIILLTSSSEVAFMVFVLTEKAP